MKKTHLKPQQSCTELSKYKFIPPAKLMKVKNPHHFQSLIQSNSITTNQSFIQQEQVLTANSKKKEGSSGNAENQRNGCKKQEKIYRSISNPRIQPSRNAILTQKTQPCQGYKNQQAYMDKLTAFIHQFQQKQNIKNFELANLRQQNQQLSQKLQKALSNLNQKNKQVIDLNTRNHQLESLLREKSQQHSLIVDSLSKYVGKLEKIIQSQVEKINQMKGKISRIQRGKMHRLKEEEDESDQFNFDDQPIGNSEVHGQIYPNDEEKLKDQRKCKRFLKFIRNSLNQQNYPQPAEADGFTEANSNRRSLENSREDPNRRKVPTPDFGSRTPTSVQHQNDHLSLQSSLEHDNGNLTLSRISESIQQDFETSRENIKQSPSQAQPVSQPPSHSVSTHQQLLDQIDQYLSKKTNFMPKR